jgi:hypothetical protein
MITLLSRMLYIYYVLKIWLIEAVSNLKRMAFKFFKEILFKEFLFLMGQNEREKMKFEGT